MTESPTAARPSGQHEVVAVHGLLARARKHLAHLRPTSAPSPAAAPRPSSSRCPSRSARRPSPAAATSTASPASNSPSTSTTPTGSRLVPCSRSARSAPASTSTRPLRRLRVLQPQLEARLRASPAGGSACRPARPATARASVPGSRAVADHDRNARGRRHLRRQHLAAHPARARGASWTCRSRSSSQLRQVVHLRAPAARAGVAARVAGVERVHVGEHHQQVGGQQDRDLRREDVVVAEADLVGRGGVVLVDDRDDAPSRAACRACGARSGTASAPRRRRTSAAPGPS